MSLLSLKLRVASILVGIFIGIIAAAIIYGVAYYFFGISLGTASILFILLFILIIDIVQWLFGPYLITAMYRAKRISATDPQFGHVVELVQEVCRLNGQKMPEVYIANVNYPNAFAYGSPLTGRRMAITLPTLRILNDDELKAVVGHEIGHLKHHDVEMLLAIGLIPSLLFYLGYIMIFSGGGRRQGGYAILVAIILMVVSFIFNILILGINRMRESYADLNAAETVPNGAGSLQTALAKIVANSGRGVSHQKSASSFVEMLMFNNPSNASAQDHEELLNRWKYMKVGFLSDFFSDHPHPARRIQMLERVKQY
ncbi:zinc metalloprotease HtpX [Thermoplasmatales archaeon AK]|nr:zinc metalloprotease HtpX [Thermoplasmatales archaeon AK]